MAQASTYDGSDAPAVFRIRFNLHWGFDWRFDESVGPILVRAEEEAIIPLEKVDSIDK